jgi:hypothetical protein
MISLSIMGHTYAAPASESASSLGVVIYNSKERDSIKRLHTDAKTQSSTRGQRFRTTMFRTAQPDKLICSG